MTGWQWLAAAIGLAGFFVAQEMGKLTKRLKAIQDEISRLRVSTEKALWQSDGGHDVPFLSRIYEEVSVINMEVHDIANPLPPRPEP